MPQALSDLSVFNRQTFEGVTEILDQEVNRFNEASNGTILMASRPFPGDYSEQSFFAAVANLVRRRNPYIDGAIGEVSLRTLVETMVKVGAGSQKMNIDRAPLAWIKQDESLAAAIFAQQLAPQIMADMLNVAVGSVYAAQSNITGLVTDITADTLDKLNLRALNAAASKLGDRAEDVGCWIMHSLPFYDLYDQNLQNGAQLFSFGTVKIRADHMGRPFIVSDIPALKSGATPPVYHILGLVPGAVAINTNDDYYQATVEELGRENIKRAMQSEWSYNVGVKGFTWDKANGGHAPTTSALLTASNWDKIVTSDRDTAGVILETN